MSCTFPNLDRCVFFRTFRKCDHTSVPSFIGHCTHSNNMMQPFVLYKSVVQLVHGNKGSPSSVLSFSFNSSPVIAFYITEKNMSEKSAANVQNISKCPNKNIHWLCRTFQFKLQTFFLCKREVKRHLFFSSKRSFLHGHSQRTTFCIWNVRVSYKLYINEHYEHIWYVTRKSACFTIFFLKIK